MGIQWSERLAVGVDPIDAQHRELFDRANALLSAMTRGDGQAEVTRLVRFLGAYVETHFGAEERLMEQHGYPDAPAHRQAHTEFVRRLTAFSRELDRAGSAGVLPIQLNNLVCGWLVEHIGVADRALARHLTARATGARRAATA